MVLVKVYKSYQDLIEESQRYSASLSFDYSKAFVPFSELPHHEMSKNIYEGHEKIPFKDRHPKFQKILLNEFID